MLTNANANKTILFVIIRNIRTYKIHCTRFKLRRLHTYPLTTMNFLMVSALRECLRRPSKSLPLLNSLPTAASEAGHSMIGVLRQSLPLILWA
jgi:hypothetical protein